MKKRALQGLGLALIIASPMWLILMEPPDYLTFGIATLLGALLLVLAHLS